MVALIRDFVALRRACNLHAARMAALPDVLAAGWDWRNSLDAQENNAKLVKHHLDDVVQGAASVTEAMSGTADDDTTADFNDLYTALNEVCLEPIDETLREVSRKQEAHAEAVALGDVAADRVYQAMRERAA